MAVNVSTGSRIDEIDLPADLAEAFRRVGDLDAPPETLREGFRTIEEALDEADVEVGLDDMYQSEPTRHAVSIGETVEHVPCVMDAMIVAFAHDTRPIEIVSQPPDGGEAVEFYVTDDEVTVWPESAVASFGIAYGEADEADLANVKETLNAESVVPSTCSVINAFPDSAAYARWAEDVSEAAVMELAVEELVAISRRAAQDYAAD